MTANTVIIIGELVIIYIDNKFEIDEAYYHSMVEVIKELRPLIKVKDLTNARLRLQNNSFGVYKSHAKVD